jgi:uncharacterized protein YuzB (UPF0349 family)
MKISICDKCKSIDYKRILNKLRKLYPDADYELGCNNMCGIGRNKVVILLDNKPIIADTENELIEKLKTSLLK